MIKPARWRCSANEKKIILISVKISVTIDSNMESVLVCFLKLPYVSVNFFGV